MTVHRFFITSDFIDTTFTLPEEISHQITQVLRLKLNEQIILLDNTGYEYLCKISELNKKHTTVEIIEKKENKNEPELSVHLYQSIIARDNFELILQKSVELGVSEITPVITERTQFDKKFVEGKYERWQKIIKEAAEQSERGKLPLLHQPLNFEAAIIQASEQGPSLIAWEKESSNKISYPTSPFFKEGGGDSNKHQVVSQSNHNSHKSISSPFQRGRLGGGHIISLFVGPEGGYTEDEISFAKTHQVLPVSLGKTILRAETATIALLAKIL